MGDGQAGKVSAHPGFQKSETSGVEVMIHSQGSDPVIYGSDGAQQFTGRYRTDPDHALIAVSTNKTLEAAGQFTLTFKPAKGVTNTPFDQFVDDDWVDIIFKKHGRVYHTMRGLIDRVGRTRSVAGSGATATTYTITGRCFQKIWEQTPIWFNRFALENIEGGWAYKIYSHIPNLGGAPDEVVKAFLLGWFEKLGNAGRVNWDTPPTLPNTTGNFFTDMQGFGFNNSGFTNYPPRVAIDPNLMNPSGTLWSLAKEWADPAFCELFCDLGKQYTQLGPEEELSPSDSTPCVFFRDRPFPLSGYVLDDTGTPANALGLEKESAWFTLPLHIINRQEIQQEDVGREGIERMNAFFVSPQLQQEMLQAGGLDMMQPHWNPEDIKRHGFRRYDISTRYKTKNANLLTLSTVQRLMLRDWYSMNPYLLSGSFSLGHGRPEIHIGTRIRIPADNGDVTADETYYVEGVSNNWQFGVGIRTALQATRGFIGTDDMLLQAIRDATGGFSTPSLDRKVPEEFAAA